MFEFDLQLFGGGGDKNPVKTVLSIGIGLWAGGYLGGAAWFGGANAAGYSLTSALMGASLFSSIWTAVSPKGQFGGSSESPTVIRFDKVQETMSSSGQIPLIYGTRKISGNQTFHRTNADQNVLYKHVVLCEGGIDGVESVAANELLIPTTGQTYNTVFTIQNVIYQDATVMKNKKNLRLYANGKSREIYLCNKDDMEKAETFFEWQMSNSALISYINRLGEGWQAFPYGATSQLPGDLHDVGVERHKVKNDDYLYTTGGEKYTEVVSEKPPNCYMRPIAFEADTVTGDTKFEFRDCSPPENYEEVGGYPNMAWLNMMFSVSSELNGNPSVSVVVRGKKVLDWRTNTTAYSTNPALCLADFFLSKTYGLGRWFTADDFDVDSWTEAANYCDEIISFRDNKGNVIREKRYTLNMVIDAKRSALEWIQEILANFCGYIVYSKGKLKLCIERQTPVSYKFNDSNCSNVKISPLSLNDTPNRYEVSIVDPLNNWTVVKCICEDFADQKQRQRVVTKSVSLEGVSSQYQALRLARFYRDYNLTCPLQISFTTGMQAMHLEPGDVVTVSYHKVFTELPIRITEIKETEKGTFEISGRQYNDTIYNDEIGGGIHWYNYSNTKKYEYTQQDKDKLDGIGGIDDKDIIDMFEKDKAKDVTYLSAKYTQAENSKYLLECSWLRMSNGTQRIYISSDGYIYSLLASGVTGSSYSSYLSQSIKYVKVVTELNGATSQGVIVEVNKETAIDALTIYNVSYEVDEDYRTVTVLWNDVSSYDLKYYNVRVAGESTVLTTVNNQYEFTNVKIGTYTVYIQAVDNLGHKGNEKSVTIRVNGTDLSIRNLIADVDDYEHTALIKWDEVSAINLSNYVIEIDSKNNYVSTLDNYYLFEDVKGGTYRVTVYAVDNTGRKGEATTITVKVEKPDLSLTGFYSVSDSKEKMVGIYWNDVYTTQIKEYVITVTGSASLTIKTTNNWYEWYNVQAGTYNITVHAVDILGQEGPKSKATETIKLADLTIRNLYAEVEKSIRYVYISWDEVETTTILYYIITINDTEQIKIVNSWYDWSDVPPGSYKVSVCAVDTTGRKGSSKTKTITVT